MALMPLNPRGTRFAGFAFVAIVLAGAITDGAESRVADAPPEPRLQEDTVPPVITAKITPPPSARGWNSTDVVVSFVCSDAGTGVAVCPPPVSLTSEGAGQQIAGTAIDKAGNARTTKVIVNIDKTAPQIAGATNPPANADGWHRGDTRVLFTCSDAGAGIASCTMPLGVSALNGQGSHDLKGTATDKAGLTATTIVRVNIDSVRPTIVATPDRPPDDSGWYNGPVTVSFTCKDDRSGVASCPDPLRVTAAGPAVIAAGTAFDRAGNGESVKLELAIRALALAPDIVAALAPLPNAAGWNNGDVTVSFTCVDNGSGIGACPPPQVVTAEGAHTITATASDLSGNARTITVPVRIDRTGPMITPAVDPAAGPGGWHRGPATVTFTCSDALSGIASCSPPALVSTDGAAQAVPGVAADQAGNNATASATINLDSTPPTIHAVASALVANHDITVTFECADALSGAADCPSPIVVIEEGLNRVVAATVHDAAGNPATGSVSVSIDRTPPTIAASIAPPPNAAGWHNTPVTVTYSCTDAGAGIAQCPATRTIDTEGHNQSIDAQASDLAGNTATATTAVNIDRTGPAIAIASPLENAVLTTSPVRVLAQLTDALSGIASIVCGSTALPGAPALDCERALTLGSNAIVVRAIDAAGNETVVTRTVQYEPTTDPTPNRPPSALPGGPYSGVTGSPIAFNGLASFDPDSHPLTFAWRFGDDTTGTGPQPSHTYATAGTFTVRLTVDDGHGGSHEAATTVTVARANTVPTAQINGPYATDVGAPLILDATSSTDADGDPLTAAWTFGDGGKGTGLTPSYTYRSTGTFTATVTISDGRGGSATGTTQVTVRALNQAPVARIGGPYHGEVNRSIAFDGSTSADPDNDAVTYAWTFGDGASDTGATPTHTFASTGSFSVTLTVTDARGGSSSASTQVTVTPANGIPTAEANGPYTREVNFPLTLSSTGSIDPDGDALTYTWRFGDGRSNTGPSPTLSYAAPGTYTIELTVNDGRGGAATDTATVTIVPRATQENRNPVAVAGGPYNAEAGVPIALNPAGSIDPDSDPLSYSWSFGDGGSSTQRAPAYAWAETGTYTVTLTVTDGRGGSASATAQTTITSPSDRAPPRVTLLGPAEVLPGTQFTVVAQVADASAIASVTFALTGGSTANDTTAPFEYVVDIPAVASPGASVVVRATATDAAGNTGSGELTMIIAAAPDDQSPTVTLNRPASAAPGSSARLSADAADNVGVTEVTFLVNDLAIGVDRHPPFEITYAVPSDASVGSVLHVTAQASDFTGNTSQATGDIDIVPVPDTTPPTVTISVPPIANPGATVHVAASPADNNGIARLQIRVDGEPRDFTTPPFQIDIPVAAAAAIGSVLRIEATATDFAGLEGSASATVRIASPFSAGEGLVLGEVYDDVLGVPLAGAGVRMTGLTTSGAPFAAETETDARGAYVLRAPAGSARLVISLDGWTTATRSIAIADGQTQFAIDARLSPYGVSQPISPVLGGTVTAGDLQVRLAPGDVATTTVLHVRSVSAQGLQAPLPLGWTPIAAIDLAPSDLTFAGGAELVAPVPAGISAGRMLHLVRWDADAAAWRVVRSTGAPGTASIETELLTTGQYAWIVGDIVPVPPPISADGELLSGAPPSALPDGTAAAVMPRPRVIIYEPGARSDVTTDVPSGQLLPSGTRLNAAIQESYDFVDNARLRLDPYVQDLFFHQGTGDPSRLRAVYPVSSSLQAEPLSLREGVISVEVRDAAPLTGAPTIGTGGGAIDGDNGVRLEIPPGGVQQLASASVQSIDAAALGLALPADVTFVGGATVSLSTLLGASGRLSMPRPAGLDPASQILLVRVIDVGGVSRLILSALGRVDGDRVTTVLELPRNGVALKGVREPGRYAFVAVTSGAAFAFGRVHGVTGDGFADALITSNTIEIASLSGADGAYVSVLRAAAGIVTALDILRSDSGSAPAMPQGAGDEIALDLRLRAEPPHVTSIAPIDGAVNVPPASPVTVRFSEPIDPASISATALTVEGGGQFVAGTVTLSDGNTVLMFRPAGEFADDTAYTVRVADVRDRSGNALSAPYTAHFSSLDTTAPPPPQAGLISATIPSGGFTTVTGSQGSAGAHDTVTIINITRGTSSPVLLDPNGGFTVQVAASFSDRLQIAITDRGGNKTIVAAPAFRQTNADGSVSTAVPAEGAHVEGPGGVAVDVPAGAFPEGTIVTLKPVSEAQFPLALSAEQRQVFKYSGGIDIDLGGRVPTRYLDVSIPTSGGETLDDQWIVGQVTYLDGQIFLDAADTARVIDGRIRTSSPPCPGVTGSGVFGFLRAARPLGVTYAGIPNPDPNLSAQLLVAAIVPMALVPGTLRTPITMPAVAGAAIAMAEATHAEFLNQSRRICMPLLSGKVTISSNTVRLLMSEDDVSYRPQLVVTNTTTHRTQNFYPPFDGTLTVEGGGSDTYIVESLDFSGHREIIAATIEPRAYVKVTVSGTVLSTDDTQLLVKNVTRNRTWSSGISASSSRPLGTVAAILEGAPDDTYVVNVTSGANAASTVRSVAFGVSAYNAGDGNLLVRAAPGSVDPTQAELNAYNASVPLERRFPANTPAVVEVVLVRPNGSTESILDAAAGSTGRVASGAFLYAFTGSSTEKYSVRVRYSDGRIESVDIPTFQITVQRGRGGDPLKEIIGQVPPRGEPLSIDLGINGAPATMTTEPDGFYHIDSRTPITLSFSQPLDRDSVERFFKLLLIDGSAPADVSGSWVLSNGNRTATFVPTWPLQMGKTYQASLFGVTAGGQPLSITNVPIQTFGPARLSTFKIPSSTPALGPLPFGDIERLNSPVASGAWLVASTTSSEGFKLHTLDVTNPRVPRKIGQTSGGIPRRLRVERGLRRPPIDVQYDVPLVAQQTKLSCWAAGAAMIVAFRDRISIDPEQIVLAAQPQRPQPNAPVNYWDDYYDGLLAAVPTTQLLFDTWGLIAEAPQTLTVHRVRDLLLQYGPLWVGTLEAAGGHVRVITGISGDGTPEGTFLSINDPWDRDADVFDASNSGSQYEDESFIQFLEKQQALSRRLYGDEASVRLACSQGNAPACNIIHTPAKLADLRACNRGDQAACNRQAIPGNQQVAVAHLSTRPSHAIPTSPGDRRLPLRGGAIDLVHGVPPASERMTALAPCTANVVMGTGPNPDPLFDGNLMATPYYSSFGSGINFFDVTDPANPCILGGRPLSRNPETVSGPTSGDLSARGTVKQYGLARGVAIVPTTNGTTAGLEAYVALQDLGLMAVDVGAEIPSKAPAGRAAAPGPIYAGDYVDVAASREFLFALNNSYGGPPSLDVLGVGLTPVSSVPFEATRNGYSKVHQLVLAREAAVRRAFPSGRMGIAYMTMAFVAGANGVTIIDVTDVEAPEVIGVVPMPGIIRTLALSADTKLLFAGGDGPGGITQLYIVDVSSPFTKYLVDRDHDGVDDRIVFTAPYAPATQGDVQGIEYDDRRGIAYVATTAQLDIWAIKRSAALANNGRPIANAGPAAAVDPGVTVTLDGSLSRDPDGDPLTYQWQQVSGPPVTLGNASTAHPTFSTTGLSNVALVFQLVVRDATATSSPAAVTITVRRATQLTLSPVIAVVPVVPGTEPYTATLTNVSGTSTNVTTHADTRYEWIGSGLSSGVNGIPNVTSIINQLSAKLGVPVTLANITVTGGVLSAQSAGVQLVRAVHRVNGADVRSEPSIVLAGLQLDSIALKPESAISALAGALAAAMGSDKNPPLVLANAGNGYLFTTGLVVLEDVTFRFAGAGKIGVRDLLDAIRPAIAVALNGLAPAGGTLITPLLMGAFTTLAGIGGTQLLSPIESTETGVATVTDEAPFKGLVSAVAPGMSAISGTLDLGRLGKADDGVLVWVLPSIDSVRVEPRLTVMRDTDPATPGPTVRMYAESTVVTTASMPLSGKGQTAAELLDRVLPDGLASWSAGLDKTFVIDAPAPGLKFRVRGQMTPSCSGPDSAGQMSCAINFTNVGLGFPVPNVFAPVITAGYSLGAPSVAQIGPAEMFDTHILHRGVPGVSSLTGSVNIVGLGSATDPTARVAVGSGPVIEKRTTTPITAAPPGTIVDFTITVTNPFSDPMSGVSVVDTLYLRAPSGSQTVLTTQTFAIGTLQPGQTRTIQTSATIPAGPGSICNEVSASGSAPSCVVIIIDSSATPARRPMINEVVFEPLQDWDDSSGGDGIPFSAVPGTGTITTADHWTELLTNTGTPAEITNWTLSFADASGAPVTMTLSPANLITRAGSPYVIVVLPSGLSAGSAMTLRDTANGIVDTVDLPAVFAALGSGSGLSTETIARVPDGAPGSAVSNFARRPASIGGTNP